MMSLISAARMSMVDVPLLAHLVAELTELRADGAVVDRVAELGDDAADQGGVLVLGDHHLLARELLERRGDLLELGGGERLGRRDLRADPARLLLEHAVDLARDRR